MASLLRQIVAGPRARHPEANLDLCYVTDNIIATSGPSSTYPAVAYRNPLKDLVRFLDAKHGAQWAIWEFRAEGTGYPDDEVYGRVRHYPWPDHHPPPFGLVPLILGGMRNWLLEDGVEGRVVVVHCKAGKGRSGTVSCSYLIAEEGWAVEEALARFTERRMRPGFGVGISIPSQQRWIRYVDRWARGGKTYVERPVEVCEVHVWGLRDGVKVAVEGFVEEGKVIRKFHTFERREREVVRGPIKKSTGLADVALEAMGRKKTAAGGKEQQEPALDKAMADTKLDGEKEAETIPADPSPPGGDVIFRPAMRIVLPTSDINLDFERRNKTKYGGFTMVTSVAHVWFNCFFEGHGPEQNGSPDDSGVFEIPWHDMDGLKGSSRKGTAAFDKLAVVWKAVAPPGGETASRRASVVIPEPAPGATVQETTPADWRGEQKPSLNLKKKLGLRADEPESASVSRASSLKSDRRSEAADSVEELKGVKSHAPGAEDTVAADAAPDAVPDDRAVGEGELPKSEQPAGIPLFKKAATEPVEPAHAEPTLSVKPSADTQPVDFAEGGVGGGGDVDDTVTGPQHLSTADLPDGVAEGEMDMPREHTPGFVKRAKKAGESSS